MKLTQKDLASIREQLVAGWISPKALAQQWDITAALAASLINRHETNDWPQKK